MNMTTEETAITAIHHYARTGEIQDVLIPFFRQTGHWVGDRRNWQKSTSQTAAAIMHRAVLPESRRTTVNNQGEAILLTSFHWRKRRNVEIPWFEVRGSIKIRSLEAVSAPNLRKVGGYIYSCTTAEVWLPNLRCVEGDFDFQSTVKLHATSLAEVGGSLMANECDLPILESVGNRFSGFWSSDLYLPNLRQVGGSLDIAGPEKIFAPTLKWVCYDLILSYLTTSFYANMLEEVGGSLDAQSAIVFQAASLRSVGDSLNTEAAPDFYRLDFDDALLWEMHPDAKRRWKLRMAVSRAMGEQSDMQI